MERGLIVSLINLVDSSPTYTKLVQFMTYSPEHIRLYIKPYCGWCQEVQAWLRRKGIKVELIDVTASEASFREMRNLSGQSKAPVMEADGELLVDFGVEELEEFWASHE